MAIPPLSSSALTTQARAEEALGIKGGEVRSLINTATDFLQNRTGRTFKAGTYTEDHPGYASAELLVNVTPLQSITSVKWKSALDDEGSTVDASSYAISDETAGVIFRMGGWTNTAQRLLDIEQTLIAGTEVPLYEVVYLGGYTLPADQTTSTTYNLPSDIEEACLTMVAQFARLRKRDPSVKSEKLLSYSVTYSDVSIPAFVHQVIDSYRRRSNQ